MIESMMEHKVQTAIQGMTHVLRYGTFSNTGGDILVSFGFTFIQKPIIFVQAVEDSNDESAQPICYVKALSQDANGYYTGCTVHTDGKGSSVNWMAIGIGVSSD